MMGRLTDIDDFLNPKTLTRRQLYTLQSETWAQGAEYQHLRTIKLLEDWIPKYYALSPNDDAAKYPIETMIEMIKKDWDE